MRRSCSCGGSNENCMFCYGSGVIDGAREVPSLVPRSGVLGSSGRKSRPLKACPVCGARVRRLERHLNKAHNGQNKVTPSPEASATTVSTAVTGTSTRPVLSSPSVPARTAVAVRHSDNHPQGFTVCSQCGARLLEKHLQRHFDKVHRAMKQQTLRSRLHGSGRAEPNKTAAPPDQLKNELLQEKLNRSMDATRGYAQSFREHGRYGSHPSHDDYDEGAP